jgi:hypothetical protein
MKWHVEFACSQLHFWLARVNLLRWSMCHWQAICGQQAHVVPRYTANLLSLSALQPLNLKSLKQNGSQRGAFSSRCMARKRPWRVTGATGTARLWVGAGVLQT